MVRGAFPTGPGSPFSDSAAAAGASPRTLGRIRGLAFFGGPAAGAFASDASPDGSPGWGWPLPLRGASLSIKLIPILIRMLVLSSCCLNWDSWDQGDFWDFVVALSGDCAGVRSAPFVLRTFPPRVGEPFRPGWPRLGPLPLLLGVLGERGWSIAGDGFGWGFWRDCRGDVNLNSLGGGTRIRCLVLDAGA